MSVRHGGWALAGAGSCRERAAAVLGRRPPSRGGCEACIPRGPDPAAWGCLERAPSRASCGQQPSARAAAPRASQVPAVAGQGHRSGGRGATGAGGAGRTLGLAGLNASGPGPGPLQLLAGPLRCCRSERRAAGAPQRARARPSHLCRAAQRPGVLRQRRVVGVLLLARRGDVEGLAPEPRLPGRCVWVKGSHVWLLMCVWVLDRSEKDA